jgi:hypothetical protein
MWNQNFARRRLMEHQEGRADHRHFLWNHWTVGHLLTCA